MLITEKDVDSDVLWTWSYPSITETFRQVILRKCCLKTDKEEFIAFCFGQFNKQWFYIFTSEVKNSDALSKVGKIEMSANKSHSGIIIEGCVCVGEDDDDDDVD